MLWIRDPDVIPKKLSDVSAAWRSKLREDPSPNVTKASYRNRLSGIDSSRMLKYSNPTAKTPRAVPIDVASKSRRNDPLQPAQYFGLSCSPRKLPPCASIRFVPG